MTVLSITRDPGHLATWQPEGTTGYLVTCPHGCNLGTSAHAASLGAALARIQLHQMTTSPLNVRTACSPVGPPSGPLCSGWDNPSDSDEVEDLGPDCLHRSCRQIAIPS
jgi:hypothetical protein